MHEIEKLIVFAQMIAQGYPQDYVEGFLDALTADIGAGEDTAKQLLSNILSLARDRKQAGVIGEVIETAFEVLAISKAHKDVQRKVEAVQRLSALMDFEAGGTFGSRIAYRKISDAVRLLKSETC